MKMPQFHGGAVYCRLALCCLLSAATLAAATPAPAAPAKPEPELFPDRVLAKGKNFEIKESQVEELFVAFKANRATRGEAVPEILRPKLEAEILDRLIATRLFMQKATPADLQRAKEIGEKFLAEQKNQLPSKEAFDRQLLALGMKPEMFRAQVMEQAAVKAVIDREIRSPLTITREDTKKFYDENPAYFQEPEMVRLSHILFSTRDSSGRQLSEEQREEKEKLAKAVLQKAKAGEDFTKLVQTYSEDFGSKTNRGEYVFARMKDDPKRATVPQVEGAAFSLSPNQLSDVVSTIYGYHIIKLLEKIPPRTIPFAEVESKIKETVLDQQVQKKMPEFIQKMRNEAEVKVFNGSEVKP